MRVSRERRARWALRVLRITDATLRSCKTHTHTHRQSKGIKQNVDRFSNPILQLVTPSEPERETERMRLKIRIKLDPSPEPELQILV